MTFEAVVSNTHWRSYCTCLIFEYLLCLIVYLDLITRFNNPILLNVHVKAVTSFNQRYQTIRLLIKLFLFYTFLSDSPLLLYYLIAK